MRNIPSIFLYLTGFFMTVSFVICGIYFHLNKIIGIWTLYAGIVFGLAGGVIYLHNDIVTNKRNSNKENKIQTNKENTNISHDTSGEILSQNDDEIHNKSKTIVNAPNSVISFDQKGGITAHTVNINEFPEPNFDTKLVAANIPQNDLFKTKILLTIESKTALKNLYLEARAPSVVSLEALAQRSGMSMMGHTGKRDGFAFTNVPSAWGQYILIILSKQPEKYDIIYNYE